MKLVATNSEKKNRTRNKTLPTTNFALKLLGSPR